MNILYRRAKNSDIELILNARMSLIEEDSGKLNELERKSLYEENKEFIEQALNNTFFSFLAFKGDLFVGTCSINLFRVLPGRKLPKGKNAYLQNIYVVPEYRRMGIGYKLTELAISEAKAKGHFRIELHATEKGKYLFEKCGFKNDISSLSHMVYY